MMTKRIVICTDGTWNTPDQENETNVIHMARSISPLSDGTPQVVFYDSGVGTDVGEGFFGRIQKFIGGVTGRGLDKNIEDAYRFLVLNYEEGDKVYLFGFSRGAYTVRSPSSRRGSRVFTPTSAVGKQSTTFRTARSNGYGRPPRQAVSRSIRRISVSSSARSSTASSTRTIGAGGSSASSRAKLALHPPRASTSARARGT